MTSIKEKIRSADILIKRDEIDVEHLRFGTGNKKRIARFDDLIRKAFAIRLGAPELYCAHLVAFHALPPKAALEALSAIPYFVGDLAFIEWTDHEDAPLQRRQLCAITGHALRHHTRTLGVEWDNFLQWTSNLDGYKETPKSQLLNELEWDWIAWTARNLPMPLWAHAIGLRQMQPLSEATLVRIHTGLAPIVTLDENVLDRQIRVADLMEIVEDAKEASSPHAAAMLVEDAAEKLSTRGIESPEDTTDRWVNALLGMRPRAERAGFHAALILTWMVDVCESGTATKVTAVMPTRRRYCTVGAPPIFTWISTLSASPSEWKADEIEEGCMKLMSDPAIKDKVGLGGAIASFLLFLHENWGTPMVSRGFHKLIPESVPRAQFVTETEVLRAVDWTRHQEGADSLLLEIVRTILALGWAAPFRIQEVMHLRIGNIVPLPDGGYEIEIVPLGWRVPLKSPAAVRRVTIPKGWASDQLRVVLQTRKDQGASSSDLLFADQESPSRVYRKYAVHSLLLRVLKLVTGDAEMTFHALRHSWASTQVAIALASSSIVDFNRFIHIADAMGHVSPAMTFTYYCHIWEQALNTHMSIAIREIIDIKSTAASALKLGEPNTIRVNGARKFGWSAETSIWRVIEQSACGASIAQATESMELALPACPNLKTSFVMQSTPMTVLNVLQLLEEDRLDHGRISAACRTSRDEIVQIKACAIEIAQQWQALTKRPGDQATVIAGVRGATSTLGINLKGADWKKYDKLREGLSVPIAVEEAFVSSWLVARKSNYIALDMPMNAVPVLRLLQAAGVNIDEISVRVQSLDHTDAETLTLKAAICRDFQLVWNRIPQIHPIYFVHEARPNGYLIYNGKHPSTSKDSSAQTTIKGLDAMLFACAVYSRIKDVGHASTK